MLHLQKPLSQCFIRVKKFILSETIFCCFLYLNIISFFATHIFDDLINR
jgi:hypothetical protein